MLKVLHLDDEIEICNVFSDLFSSDKISVQSCTQAEEAIQKVKENPPDIIFLDYRLPGTTGEEVANKMNTKIPICLITGDISLKTKYNFTAVFKKPWKTHELQAYLDSLVEAHQNPAP